MRILKTGLLIFLLSAGGLFAEDEVSRILDLIGSDQVEAATEAFEESDLEGAAKDVLLARLALAEGDGQRAMRHLAWVQMMHYREVEWLPAALYVEVLVDHQMGAGEKTLSAMDELKENYPTSDWCRRAEEELNRMEKEEANE